MRKVLKRKYGKREVCQDMFKFVEWPGTSDGRAVC